jgi:predicted ATPase
MYAQSQPIASHGSLTEKGDYLMITRLEIKNFRGFSSLSLQGLRRLNFLVGDSGSGKTALLETLFLTSCENPEAYFRLRKWRGFGEVAGPFAFTRDTYESLFRYLFHNGNLESIGRISFVDNIEGKRSLDVYFENQSSLKIDIAQRSNIVNFTPISFKWDVSGHVDTIKLEVIDGTLKGRGSAKAFPLNFLSPRNMSANWDAQLFSALSRNRGIEEVLSVIQQSFNYILDLSLELNGGETLIHARIPGFKQKIPIYELSGGLNKYLTIALAIANNPNGVICVDEIDNGFYHAHHGDIVRSLHALCEKFSVQLFASTHSWEFLKAVADVMKDNPDQLSLLRTKYVNNECVVRKSDGASAISAIESDIEVRD